MYPEPSDSWFDVEFLCWLASPVVAIIDLFFDDVFYDDLVVASVD